MDTITKVARNNLSVSFNCLILQQILVYMISNLTINGYNNQSGKKQSKRVVKLSYSPVNTRIHDILNLTTNGYNN